MHENLFAIIHTDKTKAFCVVKLGPPPSAFLAESGNPFGQNAYSNSPDPIGVFGSLHLYDVSRLRPFRTFDHVKADGITFGQRLEALIDYRRIVHKNLFAIIHTDKTKAFCVVKPFNGTLCQKNHHLNCVSCYWASRPPHFWRRAETHLGKMPLSICAPTGLGRSQPYAFTTLAACGPFRAPTTSKRTGSSSFRALNPFSSIAE